VTAQATMQGYAPTVTVEKPAVVTMRKGDKWDRSIMGVNQQAWIIRSNVRRNIRRQIPQLAPHNPQPNQHIAIVGGGWSLNDPVVYEELRSLYFEGVKLVALNGAARWLMERNLRPSLHIVLDSRAQNIAFVRDPIPGCRYMLASQCDPSLFDACEDRDTTIFHLHSEDEENARRPDPISKRIDSFYNGRWTKVPTAGTVGVVAPMLCRILGFEFQHIFGLDSCYDQATGNHHAYPQALNDGEGSVDFSSGDRVFHCSAWQASQAQTFMDMLSAYGNVLQIEVHGDGLIAHMIKQAALEAERSERKEA
jgi:hypothetical protein